MRLSYLMPKSSFVALLTRLQKRGLENLPPKIQECFPAGIAAADRAQVEKAAVVALNLFLSDPLTGEVAILIRTAVSDPDAPAEDAE
jgi:hypothetical protein